MKLKIYGIIWLVCLLAAVSTAPIRAEQDTAMVGVDEDQLFAGAWFTLTPQLDLMGTFYDNAYVGWGFDYHQPDWALKVKREWHSLEAAFNTERGALHYGRDDSAGTESGAANWNYGKLGLTGSYSTNEDSYTSGVVNVRWNGTANRSLLHSAYRKDDGVSESNYRLKDGWRTKNGTWSLELQDNMYSEGSDYIIGDGVELAWDSPREHWRVAVGRFHETESDIAGERWQLQWQDQYEKQFDRTSVGFDTEATGYLYEGAESQQVGSISGWWRYNFGPGSLKWNLENIWRAGTTPFEFDYEDEHSFYTGAVFEWQGAVYHSKFSLEYDLQDSEWREARGLLEAPFWDWSGSLTANYDLDTDFTDSELVYLLLVTSPEHNLVVDHSFNYQLSSLDTNLEWKLGLASGDGLRMKFAYDWDDKELDNLLFEYRVAAIGKFTLTYDLDKPKVMLVYTWAPEPTPETLPGVRRGRRVAGD